jgi:hypothetical protein
MMGVQFKYQVTEAPHHPSLFIGDRSNISYCNRHISILSAYSNITGQNVNELE